MLKKRILRVWKNYITSQFLVTLFIFGMTWLMGSFTGLRFALVNAIAAAICEVIPNFGPIISGVISAALALIFGSSKLDWPNWQFAILIIGLCLVIQLLQNWLVSPMIIGKSMDLHPLLIFVGMLICSFLFGFWGMILAVPIIGTFKEVLKYAEEKKKVDTIEIVSKPTDKIQIVEKQRDEKQIDGGENA